MAVSKSFFLRRKGVVGSLQMARVAGKQITKDKSSSYNDAQTRAQLIQRMCMATATAFYKEGKDVLSWSVEGARNTNEAMHFLYNKNVAILKELAQQEKGMFKKKGNDFLAERNTIISPMFVSYGSLCPIKYNPTTFFLCDAKKWQVKKGDSIIICGWRGPQVNENGLQFMWYKIDFFENPSEDFFENVSLSNVYERMQQFSRVTFSNNSRINESNYILQVTTHGRLRLSVAGIANRYTVIRVRNENEKWYFSTSRIIQPSQPTTNFVEALASYGVPRDKILNGE